MKLVCMQQSEQRVALIGDEVREVAGQRARSL